MPDEKQKPDKRPRISPHRSRDMKSADKTNGERQPDEPEEPPKQDR
jgi:hypothetical protein